MATSTDATFARILRAAQQDTTRRLGDAQAELAADVARRAEAGRMLDTLFARVPTAGSGSASIDEDTQAVIDAEIAAQRQERSRGLR